LDLLGIPVADPARPACPFNVVSMMMEEELRIADCGFEERESERRLQNSESGLFLFS
jgi:hypothetical protein